MPPGTMPTVVSLALSLSGIVLICLACLYEVEANKLQDRLQVVWIELDELQVKALGRQGALLQRVAALAERDLSKLLGPRLVSLKSVASCFCFSVGSMACTYLLLFGLEQSFSPAYRKYPFIYLLSATFWLVCGISRRGRYLFFLLIPGLIALFITVGVLHPQGGYSRTTPLEVFEYLGPLIAGVLCDVVFVAFSRWLLRRSATLSNASGLMFFAFLNVAMGVVLVSGLFVPLLLRHRFSGVGQALKAHSKLWAAVATVSATNMFSAAVAFFAVALMTAALLHRLLWPMIKRPLYAIHRHELIKNPKLLWGIGIALLMAGLPNNPVIKLLGQIFH
jgi:hypothetical protein